MKTRFSVLRSKGVKFGAAVAATGAALASSFANAIDDAAITAAQTSAETSVELTTTGMIQIVAVIVGVGLVVSLLKRV